MNNNNNTIHNEGRAFRQKIRNLFPSRQTADSVYGLLTLDIIPNMLNTENQYEEEELQGITWEHIQEWFREDNITEDQAKRLEDIFKDYMKQRYSKVQQGGKRKKTRKHKKRSKKTRKH